MLPVANDQCADIGGVFLRFNGSAMQLERAVRSLLSDPTDASNLSEIVLVDNASTVDPDAVERVAKVIDDPRIRILRNRRNLGFAGGVNAGIRLLSSQARHVLLMNDDAHLAAGALTHLRDALASASKTTFAMAPLLYLEDHPGIIESIGMSVNRRSEARNTGLGQFDIGQFSHPARTLGPSFAAGLFRRSAFEVDEVGPLAEEYFLYYEDVEWNWRANLLGYTALTCPKATGTHAVSSSSRTDRAVRTDYVIETIEAIEAIEASYAFKHRFIEANLLATAARCLDPSNAIHVWAHRWPRLVKGRVTGRFPQATFGAAVDSFRRLPQTLRARRAIQRRRVVTDEQIFALEARLPILFDPVTYEPNFSWSSLARTALAAEAALIETGKPGMAAQRFRELAELAGDQDTEAAFGWIGNSPLAPDFRRYIDQLK
jgi:GT2 family glycosyltransferase